MKMILKWFVYGGLLVLGFGLKGCESDPGVYILVADIKATDGYQMRGEVQFLKVKGGVEVRADLRGLLPGKHGMHIHEFGDCRANDGTSAGGHFNPLSKKHGDPNQRKRHDGDLGNIEADRNGRAKKVYLDNFIRLQGPRSIVGRAIVIHEEEDDLVSQPTGAAGKRVGCGVLGVAQVQL